MTAVRSQVREGFFGSDPVGPINSSRPSQDPVVRQLVGAGAAGRHLEFVQGLPFDLQAGAVEDPVSFLNRPSYHPLHIELIGRLGQLDTEEPSVLIPVGIHTVDDIIAARLAAVALGDRPITACEGKSEDDDDGKGSHV